MKNVNLPSPLSSMPRTASAQIKRTDQIRSAGRSNAVLQTLSSGDTVVRQRTPVAAHRRILFHEA